MVQQALRPLLEALCQTAQFKNIEGAISDPTKLLSDGALAQLDARHSGMFAIFLYDIAIDHAVAAYLRAGSLANDSGPFVLALFEGAPRPRRSAGMADIGVVLHEENPIVTFSRQLFPDHPVTLPGVVLLKRMAHASDAVYVPLQGNQEAVTALVRKLFALLSVTDSGAEALGNTFGERTGIALAKAGITYQRSEPLSVGEHVAKFLLLLWKHRRDLIAQVPVIGKMLSKQPEKETE